MHPTETDFFKYMNIVKINCVTEENNESKTNSYKA